MKNLRYERKFAAEVDDIDDIVYQIKQYKALFKEIHKQRRVNSIYFDTNGLQYYQDNLFGKSKRHKVRVRWYGNDIEIIKNANLEIKSKNAHVGTKDTYNIGDFKLKNFLNDFSGIIDNSSADDSIKRIMPSLRPTILVSYSRRYFMSADSKYRITLDFDLKFWDLHSGFNLLKKVDTNICVIELKYSYENDDLVNLISENIPYRYSKSSKYAIGLELIL